MQRVGIGDQRTDVSGAGGGRPDSGDQLTVGVILQYDAACAALHCTLRESGASLHREHHDRSAPPVSAQLFHQFEPCLPAQLYRERDHVGIPAPDAGRDHGGVDPLLGNLDPWRALEDRSQTMANTQMVLDQQNSELAFLALVNNLRRRRAD